MSTMEKTPISWFKMIFAAEYLFRFVPRGTHDWNKFINSEKLADLIQKNNFTIINI
jgi:2-polyprenyl-3-methyl-5-hydroxy-6-metoxy-1,4-benzoquinol methylase